jgi:arylsulfatase A-like enzyme
LVVVVMGLLLACSGDELPPGDASRPDVILVSIDSLRPDHLGAWGSERATSPFLDSLAARGLRFTEARSSSPWTLPSHVTLLSGRPPLEHAVIEDDRCIPDDLPMVQEAFQAAGYATAGFVSTIYVSDTYGFARGFDRYEDFDIAKGENLHHTVRAARVVDEALSWAHAQSGKPVFLFLHLYDVHYPYLPPEPWNYQFDKPGSKKSTHYRNYDFYKARPVAPERWSHLIAQYDESIAYADAQLARLGAAWEGSGRRVSWVVTADHGEELGERGSWGHGHTLFPEVMRVPLIVSGAAVSSVAVRDERVQTMDVPTTLAGIAGISFAGRGVDVRGDIPERDQVFETSRFDSARLGLLTGALRLDVDFARDRVDVFHVDTDPAEKVPTLDDPAALAGQLYTALGAPWHTSGTVITPGWIVAGGRRTDHRFEGPGEFAVYPLDAAVGGTATRSTPLPPTVSLSDATREQLKALGYEQ